MNITLTKRVVPYKYLRSGERKLVMLVVMSEKTSTQYCRKKDSQSTSRTYLNSHETFMAGCLKVFWVELSGPSNISPRKKTPSIDSIQGQKKMTIKSKQKVQSCVTLGHNKQGVIKKQSMQACFERRSCHWPTLDVRECQLQL